MANSIFITVDNITTNSARIRLGNNTSAARNLTLRVFNVEGMVLVYQNNYYLPPHQYTFIAVKNLNSNTQYRVSGTYNTEETVAYFTTQTPYKTITGRVNVIKDNLAEIQGRVFVSNQTIAEISGKVCVRIATPEKLPEDWRYDNEPQPEDWDNVEKDATSWEETDKVVDSWSENEKENVNWQRGEEAHHQKWKYPLKDTG